MNMQSTPGKIARGQSSIEIGPTYMGNVAKTPLIDTDKTLNRYKSIKQYKYLDSAHLLISSKAVSVSILP